jgi:ribokinase
VIGIGYAVIDYLGIIPHMPQFDDVRSAGVQEWLVSGGGPVGTALVALARLGARVAYIGQLGDDMIGRAVRREFVREGVDVSRLQHRTDVRSPSTLALVEAGTGRRAFISFKDPDADMELAPSDRRAIESAAILHMDSWYPALGLPAARIARQAGVQVSLDAYRMTDRTAEWVALTDILIAAEPFTRDYTGHTDLEQASRALLEQGPHLVVTTLSERGCFVATQDTMFHAPGLEVTVVDTTGAGDAFHGAFLYGLLQAWKLPQIARFANVVGALACRALGGRTSIPALDEVKPYL